MSWQNVIFEFAWDVDGGKEWKKISIHILCYVVEYTAQDLINENEIDWEMKAWTHAELLSNHATCRIGCSTRVFV